MSSLPFPSNQNSTPSSPMAKLSTESPWKRTHPNDPPLIMFQVQFASGRVNSYAYSDLREIQMRDAGYLQLCLYGMEKYHITIIGRNLTELANLIGLGKIKSFVELGPQTFEREEGSASIDEITIETLTGPTY